jgi:hypothetical protein
MTVNILLWETPNLNKSDKKYNIRWRILLCADENLIVSFEFTHLLRRNYGWDCLSPIRLI